MRQFGGQHAAQHGFAAAYLAHHFDDAFALANGVAQRCEYFSALRPRIPVFGIGRDAERGFLQPEIIEVHPGGLFASVRLHAAIQCGAIDAQQFGGLRQVAVGHIERGFYVSFFPFAH